MSKKPVLALLAAVALTLAAAPGSASPTAPGPTLQPQQPPQVKGISVLTAKNVAAVPGENKSIEAHLAIKAAEPSLAGKTILFKIHPKDNPSIPASPITLGAAVTDANGVAKLTAAMPELAQGNYTIKASFAGDQHTVGSHDDANLFMVKGITAVDMGSLIWGTYKDEPGAPYGSIGFSLRRTVDSKSLARPVTITVNGHSWQLAPNVYHQIALPTDTTTWKVKVQFDGDGVYQPTSIEKTFHKPN